MRHRRRQTFRHQDSRDGDPDGDPEGDEPSGLGSAPSGWGATVTNTQWWLKGRKHIKSGAEGREAHP
jgi:hypothetical protein